MKTTPKEERGGSKEYSSTEQVNSKARNSTYVFRHSLSALSTGLHGCNSEAEFSCKLNPQKLSIGELARISGAKLCCWNLKGSFTKFTEHFWSPLHVEHLTLKLTGSSLWIQTDNSFLSLEQLCTYSEKL